MPPGCVITLTGKLVCKTDAPKVCFTAEYVKDSGQQVDYFTCATCSINWVCEVRWHTDRALLGRKLTTCEPTAMRRQLPRSHRPRCPTLHQEPRAILSLLLLREEAALPNHKQAKHGEEIRHVVCHSRLHPLAAPRPMLHSSPSRGGAVVTRQSRHPRANAYEAQYGQTVQVAAACDTTTLPGHYQPRVDTPAQQHGQLRTFAPSHA